MKAFNYCFDNWLRPILFFVITSCLFAVSNSASNKIFSKISFLLFGLGLLVLFVSAIYQLITGRWIKSIFTGVLLGGAIMACVFYVLVQFAIETIDGDKWADNLKIPDNISLNLPKGDGYLNSRPDSIVNIKRSKPDIEIYNASQPGIYEFDYWSDRMECGTIYLKAYEITQEYALSTNSLPERSSVHVCNPTDSIKKFGTKYDFIIYEGDWGKPYAARFEVWFKPDNGGVERKLMEKNYKIEGWMR